MPLEIIHKIKKYLNSKPSLSPKQRSTLDDIYRDLSNLRKIARTLIPWSIDKWEPDAIPKTTYPPISCISGVRMLHRNLDPAFKSLHILSIKLENITKDPSLMNSKQDGGSFSKLITDAQKNVESMAKRINEWLNDFHDFPESPASAESYDSHFRYRKGYMIDTQTVYSLAAAMGATVYPWSQSFEWSLPSSAGYCDGEIRHHLEKMNGTHTQEYHQSVASQKIIDYQEGTFSQVLRNIIHETSLGHYFYEGHPTFPLSRYRGKSDIVEQILEGLKNFSLKISFGPLDSISECAKPYHITSVRKFPGTDIIELFDPNYGTFVFSNSEDFITFFTTLIEYTYCKSIPNPVECEVFCEYVPSTPSPIMPPIINPQEIDRVSNLAILLNSLMARELKWEQRADSYVSFQSSRFKLKDPREISFEVIRKLIPQCSKIDDLERLTKLIDTYQFFLWPPGSAAIETSTTRPSPFYTLQYGIRSVPIEHKPLHLINKDEVLRLIRVRQEELTAQKKQADVPSVEQQTPVHEV